MRETRCGYTNLLLDHELYGIPPLILIGQLDFLIGRWAGQTRTGAAWEPVVF